MKGTDHRTHEHPHTCKTHILQRNSDSAAFNVKEGRFRCVHPMCPHALRPADASSSEDFQFSDLYGGALQPQAPNTDRPGLGECYPHLALVLAACFNLWSIQFTLDETGFRRTLNRKKDSGHWSFTRNR